MEAVGGGGALAVAKEDFIVARKGDEEGLDVVVVAEELLLSPSIDFVFFALDHEEGVEGVVGMDIFGKTEDIYAPVGKRNRSVGKVGKLSNLFFNRDELFGVPQLSHHFLQEPPPHDLLRCLGNPDFAQRIKKLAQAGFLDSGCTMP